VRPDRCTSSGCVVVLLDCSCSERARCSSAVGHVTRGRCVRVTGKGRPGPGGASCQSDANVRRFEALFGQRNSACRVWVSRVCFFPSAGTPHQSLALGFMAYLSWDLMANGVSTVLARRSVDIATAALCGVLHSVQLLAALLGDGQCGSGLLVSPSFVDLGCDAHEFSGTGPGLGSGN